MHALGEPPAGSSPKSGRAVMRWGAMKGSGGVEGPPGCQRGRLGIAMGTEVPCVCGGCVYEDGREGGGRWGLLAASGAGVSKGPWEGVWVLAARARWQSWGDAQGRWHAGATVCSVQRKQAACKQAVGAKGRRRRRTI